jgi:hypothetical protein
MSGSNSSNPAAAATRDAQPLHLTVHAMPQADIGSDEARQRTARGRLKMLLVLAACAAPVVASYLSYYVLRPQGRANYATLIEPSRTIPAALPLTDLAGRAVSAESLKGQWLLVVVGRGACDGDCEHRLFMQRQLREMTGRERDRIDKLWLVIDDAPIAPALRAALDAAPATQILRVPAAAVQQWLQAAPGESLESHLYLVDPMGQWMMRAPPQAQADKFKRDIDRLLRASSFWDRPGR